MTENSVAIFERAGATSVSVTAYIKDDGAILVEGYDIGEAPSEYWGDSDYEYLVYVNQEYKDKLLGALVQACGEEGGVSTNVGALRRRVDRLLPGIAVAEAGLEVLSRLIGESDDTEAGPLSASDKDGLILALIENVFGGNPTAVSAFQSFCKDHDVPAEFWSPT
jgi:hypothetical protein